MAYIEIKNFNKTLNGNRVLDDINLQLEQGKIYGLVGKNGSGKTMLLRAVSGLICSDSGEVTVAGEKVGHGKYPKSLGVVIENISLFGYLSAFQNLKLLNDISATKISGSEIRQWLADFGLDPNDRKAIKKYSLGMCQKVSLIQAFMNKPDLILLDEPTNALDDTSVETLLGIIKNTNETEKTTFIISSHDRASISRVCDEIIEMRNGKIESEAV